MLTFMFSAFQSQGASVTKEPALHTIEREGASVTLFNFWKFSNVIFSNFPIQRIPVLVKNSGGIYRRCYFCLIRTPKVTKKRLSEHFCHRWWPKGAIALQRATVVRDLAQKAKCSEILWRSIIQALPTISNNLCHNGPLKDTPQCQGI